MADITVGYWNMRGIAEPIRYILHYKGVQFEDKRYPLEKLDTWFIDRKYTLGLPFPNLPYYIEGDLKLTHSNAILRYLAEKHGLDGQTQEEKLRTWVVEQQMYDFTWNLIRLSYGPEFESKKPEYVKNVPKQLQLIADFLGDRKFMAGERLTYVDFMAHEAIDFHRLFIKNLLDDFPTLLAFQNRIRNLPELREYFASSQYLRWPVFARCGAFGGHGPEPEY